MLEFSRHTNFLNLKHFVMIWTARLSGLFLILGLACIARAAPGDEIAQKRKSVKPTISSIKQKDGSIIERLDLATRPDLLKPDRIPSTPEEWLSRMLDPTRNGLVLKHPKLFAAWLDAVTEPRFMTALATVALDPNSYPRTFNRVLDPATARNWGELADPEVFMRWVAAGMDPGLYQAVFQYMFDPSKYLRWATHPGTQPPDGTAARETSQSALTGSSRTAAVDVPAAESWRQLSAGPASVNPWLMYRETYRY